MGNFYCNFTLQGASRDEIARILNENRRSAFVSPTVGGRTIVYERQTDDLDGGEILAIGSVLSMELACPALAALVADDDILCLGLFIGGELQVDYCSRGNTRGAVAICRAFRRPWVAPAMWLLLQWPWFVFEHLRHILAAKLLGIPATWVVGGYRYISENDGPFEASNEGLLRTGRAPGGNV